MSGPSNEAAGRNRRRWWRLYVHKIQMRYAIMVGVMVLVFSLLIFGLAIIGPSITLDAKTASHLPLSERAQFATRLLFGGETKLPIILVVLVPGAVLFSFYLTHRLAGPLYRFEKSAAEIHEGNLALRIRLRSGDDLQELAEMLNKALSKIDQALGDIRDHRTNARRALQRCVDDMRAQAPAAPASLDQLELAAKEGEQIDAILSKFRLTDPR